MTHYYTIDFQLGFFHKALHHHSFPAYLSHKYTFKPGASYYLLPTSFTSIARAMGSFINHVVKFLDIFDLPPPSWSLLLNKAKLCNKMIIWLTPSPLTVHVVFELKT